MSAGVSTASSATEVDRDHDVGAETDPPQVSALFLIRFDKRVGYTVAWKRSNASVTLDGAVEYKSLPSGLHTLTSDLVYFVHEGYAGLSAFAKGEAGAEERNAQFVSVGILVSRAYGRLGRSWLLASKLKQLAETLSEDVERTAPLEEFWEQQSSGGEGGGTAGPSKSEEPATNGKSGRKRALSTLTSVVPSEKGGLVADHPALSMLKYVADLGPLVFRLQQAALLRKRILFIGPPPVRTCCEFVYNLSVLSSIPPHAADLVSPGTEALLRLPALFSIGVHDIPELEQLQAQKAHGAPEIGEDLPSQGWVACTTDEIITTKKKLFDIVVKMPATYDAPPQKKVWPIMKTSDGTQIKASQRDLRRWKMLQLELRKHRRGRYEDEDEDDGGDDDNEALLRPKASCDAEDDLSVDDSIIEPTTWPQVAYSGFMWWASAGEQPAYTTTERDRDRDLLGDLSDYADALPTAIIAYFHRSTTQLIQNLNSIIERSDDEETEEDDGTLLLDKGDVSRMGLDTWSEADRAFLSEFSWLWYGRMVDLSYRRHRDCCGVRMPVF
ncbi:uncharacterized protein N0V89_000774 [Didymosphaeria variabile]|uniref:DUF4484 domain-containing protein n=1 Tax=Didymosphaeria variabile TaxID=1932322 RepID=A0A9W9CG09_9PLEO|nr:uncharacterized protein N0V89_000774 [Didymosphaeria variabile]KAJ4360214.1 hypothetical protein N0V89_000774 [Didymosphaeria variabile]